MTGLPLRVRALWAFNTLIRRLGMQDVSKAAARPLEQRRGRPPGRLVARPAPQDVDVRELTVPGRDGPVPARAYRPRGAAEPLPTLVLIHGGGWILGSPDVMDPYSRWLCHDVGIAVLSVDYRLAPEHVFPAGYQDCVDVFEWVLTHGAEHGFDPTRVAVGGDSSGGNLAAAVALHARDAGLPLAAQVLVYPVVEAEVDTPAMRGYRGPGLQRHDIDEMVDVYLGGDRGLRRDPRVSPLLAASLAGVAPALVLTAELDILHDQGRRYAGRLVDAGVPARQVHYAQAAHAFLTLDRLFPEAPLARAEVAAELARRLDVGRSEAAGV